MERALAGKSILVVEDEPFIAYDIVDGIERAGGRPLGPAGTVKAALELLRSQPADAAVLDVNLHDGDVDPVVEALMEMKLPFVFHTGAGLTDELKRRCPGCEVYYKPTPPERLADAVASMIFRVKKSAHGGGAQGPERGLASGTPLR